MSHSTDCENRNFRIIDDYRGFRCEKDQGPNYPSSVSSTVYMLDKQGDQWQIKGMASVGTWVAQFYDTEGSSQMVTTNSTSRLVEVKNSDGSIRVSGGQAINDLTFEWADKDLKWDQDRDLKAREPTLATGQVFEDDAETIKNAIKQGIVMQKTIAQTLDKTEDSLKRAHRYNLNNLLPAFHALDYNALKSVAEELLADKSEAGVSKANVFLELLSSTGTTASAMVIKDLILEGKYDNDRDAARSLTAIPFHIRCVSNIKKKLL